MTTPPKPISEMYKDRYGQVVAEPSVEHALRQGAHELKSLLGMVRQVEKRADYLSHTDIGHELNRADIKHQCGLLKKQFTHAQPWCKCPQHQRRGCKWCKGKGWISKGQYEVLPEEFKP